MINARAETIADKPAFRSAFKRSEWKKGANAKTKQPHYIRLRKDEPFAFAGLAERWSRNSETIESCTLITTDPNELMAEIHDRMPVILSPDDYDLWLDPEFERKEKLLWLMRPYPADEMKAYPISTLVNSPKNDVAACIEAAV
jgi:putative SOS response-associated peptidase YedK